MQTVVYKAVRRLFSASALSVFLAVGSPPGALAAEVSAVFSPGGQITARVVGLIDGARQSVRVAAYSFTSVPVGKALERAHRRGIDVQVVVDKDHNRRGNKASDETPSVASFLASNGVPVRISRNFAIQHSKYVIIDGRHVQTGSFNYSDAAERRNSENAVFVQDAPDFAKTYAANWQTVFDTAQALPARY